MPTLDELLNVPTVDAILDGEVLPAMRDRGLSVTAWAPLDPWRILSYVTATLRRLSRITTATRTAAGLGEYVFGRVAPPAGVDVTGWAPIRARSWYGVTQIDARYTKRSFTLTNTSASAYGPLAQGTMIVRIPNSDHPDGGFRYIQDDDAVTIPGSGSVDVVFRSEFPVDTAEGYTYDDPSSSTIEFVTANYPGVTATNPAPTFSDTAQVGSGLGTVTPSGTPGSSSGTIVATITGTGNVGAGTWSVSLNGGAPTTGTIGVLANFGGSGVTVTPANGGGSPAFIAGAAYYIAWPGSDVVEAGRDAETAYALGTRCYAVWPSLSFTKDASGNWIPFVPTLSAIEAITRSISDQVAVCLVRTSTTVANQIEIRVAAQGALLPSSTLALIALYWQTFNGLGTRYNVTAPSTVAINLAGATVKATASVLATAQEVAQARVSAYLKGTDPANQISIGDGTAIVDRSYINSLIRSTPGVTYMDDGLTIEGAATDFVIPTDYLCTYAEDIATTLTWIPS